MVDSGLTIAFAGTPGFAAQHLQGLISAGMAPSLVISQPDKPGKRGKKLIPTPVKQVALASAIPVTQPARLSTAVFDELPRKPDILIVVAYGQILKQALLDYPRLGCINVHASLLPRWRGAAPIQRAIEAGDELTGVCIMQMDAGLDTGDILYREEVVIDSIDTTTTLSGKLVAPGIRGLHEVILGEGSMVAQRQVTEGVTYAHKITKGEAEINWTNSALSIARKINALNPDPVAYSQLNNLRIRFWSAQAGPSAGPCSDQAAPLPGQVISLDKHSLRIGTGNGTLIVNSLQIPLGKGKVLAPRDLLSGFAGLLKNGVQFNAANHHA